MSISVEDAQQFILGELRKSQKGNLINSGELSRASYDVHLDIIVLKLRQIEKIPDPNDLGDFDRSFQDKQALQLKVSNLSRVVSDALWELCRRGILRPGINHTGDTYIAVVNAINEGFSVTTYGLEWLNTYTQEDVLPATLDRFTQIFDGFQSLFGKSYFKRSKEAVSCFQGGNYLACCVMCGTAVEAILLSAAFIVADPDDVIKMYYRKNGRGQVEQLLFGNTKDHIKNHYKKYTDLIGYWRNESGHGEESEIDVNEAYIAMLTLLRFSEFMRDHWNEVTSAVLKT